MGIDALITASLYTNCANFIISSIYTEHGWQVNYAEEIKNPVHIPVFTVNRINESRVAESILAAGKADIIGMGRGALADPDLPNKANAGKLDSIRMCIGCLQGCVSPSLSIALHCLVNPIDHLREQPRNTVSLSEHEPLPDLIFPYLIL